MRFMFRALQLRVWLPLVMSEGGKDTLDVVEEV